MFFPKATQGPKTKARQPPCLWYNVSLVCKPSNKTPSRFLYEGGALPYRRTRMGVKLRYLLVLLLLLVPADDLWATTSPDPAADPIAAENNNFPLAVNWQRQQRPVLKRLFTPNRSTRPIAPLTGAPTLSGDRREPAPKTPVGPSLLYALMSLQR
jgi:hypothetical protein